MSAAIMVADLAGAQLDAWVARAEGLDASVSWDSRQKRFVAVILDPALEARTNGDATIRAILSGNWSPSTNPTQGQPLMECERIGVDTWQGQWAAMYGTPVTRPERAGVDPRTGKAWPKVSPSHCRMLGATMLEAAMRCRVARAFGDEVPA